MVDHTIRYCEKEPNNSDKESDLIKFILPKVLGIGETNWPDLCSKFNQFSFQNSDVEIGDSWLVLWMGRYSSNIYFSDEFVIFGS